jgi:hypothetical protein
MTPEMAGKPCCNRVLHFLLQSRIARNRGTIAVAALTVIATGVLFFCFTCCEEAMQVVGVGGRNHLR